MSFISRLRKKFKVFLQLGIWILIIAIGRKFEIKYLATRGKIWLESQERKQIYKSPPNVQVLTNLKQQRHTFNIGNLNGVLCTSTSNNEIISLVSSNCLLFYRNFFCSFSKRHLNLFCIYIVHVYVCVFIDTYTKQPFCLGLTLPLASWGFPEFIIQELLSSPSAIVLKFTAPQIVIGVHL